MTRICCIFIFLSSVVFSDILSTTGEIKFDTQMDNSPEMTLNQTGLGIGMTPSANLSVNGNTIVSGQLSVGGTSGSSNLNINGTLGVSIQNTSSNANLSDHSFVLLDSSSGNIVAKLPYAGNCSGRTYTLKKTSPLNSIYVTGGGNAIDSYELVELGANTQSLAYLTVISNGLQWFVLEGEHDGELGSSNLLTLIKFDEGSGTSLVDSISNVSYSKIDYETSGNGWVTGIIGSGLSFDGSDDYALADSSFSYGNLTEYTVSVWCKFDASTIVQKSALVYKVGPDFELFANTNNAMHFYAKINGVWAQQDVTSAYTDWDEWHHWVARYDGATTSLYKDGLEVAFSSISGNLNSVSAVMRIGNSSDNSKKIGPASIEDLRVYSRALDPDEIQGLYEMR